MAENINEITFLGVDKVTPVVKKIESVTTTSMKEMERRQRELDAAFQNVTSSTKAFASTVKNLALIGIGAAGSIFLLAKNYANYAEQLSISASRTGLSVETFQKLTYAANQNNVSMEELTTSLAFLGRAKAKALADPESQEALAFLGAGIDENYLKTHDLKDIMLALSSAYSKSTDTSKKLLSQQTLLGRASANLSAMLNEGKENFEATIKEAERYGYVLSGDALKAANDLDDSIDRMFGSLAGVKNMIGEQLLPILKPMIDSWNEWFAGNKELIKLKIGDFIKQAAINLKIFWEGLKKISVIIWETVSALGGLKNILIALISLKLAGLAVSLIKVGQSVFYIAKAFASVSLLSLLNPVTITIAAIIALGFAIYKIYQNWDTLKEKFKEIWPSMVSAFEGFLNVVTFGIYGLVQDLLPSWDQIKEGFALTWSFIKESFTALIDWLLPANSYLGKKMRAMWEGFKEYFYAFFDSLKDYFFSWVNSILKGVNKVYNTVAKLFKREEKPLIADVMAKPKELAPTNLTGIAAITARENALAGLTPEERKIEEERLGNDFFRRLAITPAKETLSPLAQTIQNEKKVEAVTPIAPVTEDKPVRLFINMKVDAEGRPKDIKATSNIPLQFEANTGVII